MTCGRNFEHAIFFEMSTVKVLSKFCQAKIHKRSFNRSLRMAATVSDWKTIPETADNRTVTVR